MSKLYVVGTPIGNLKDITYRGIETLKAVDFIICEDTRVTSRLLSHYEISKPLVSYHQHSKLVKIDKIVDRLKAGESAALVTDAGTPGIADPGGKLVEEVRQQAPETEVITIPGPSALTATASICGLAMDRFSFLGFIPHKKGRETLLRKATSSELPVMLYESPHRIIKSLTALESLMGSEQKLVVAKELSKLNELCVTGTAKTVLKYFQDNPDRVKGEFVIVVGPSTKEHNKD